MLVNRLHWRDLESVVGEDHFAEELGAGHAVVGLQLLSELLFRVLFLGEAAEETHDFAVPQLLALHHNVPEELLNHPLVLFQGLRILPFGAGQPAFGLKVGKPEKGVESLQDASHPQQICKLALDDCLTRGESYVIERVIALQEVASDLFCFGDADICYIRQRLESLLFGSGKDDV